MLALGLVLSAAIGLALGMLGGGGSILTVPALHYVFGLDAHAAIAASLAVVAITGLAALIPHARAGRVQWRVGAWFGASSMAGAYGAARIGAGVPGTVLLAAFGGVMLLTAGAMLRGRRSCAVAPDHRHRALAVVAQGVAVGAIAGLIGAGGGFLIVPALVMLARMAMPQAIATSLLVIVLNSLAGFAGACTSVPIHGRVIAIVSGIAVLGSVAGARLAGRIAPDHLRRLFGWLVLAMGTFVLGKELPRAIAVIRDAAGGARAWPWLLGAAIAIAAGWTSHRIRRRRRPSGQGADHHGGTPDAVSPALRS